MLFGTFVPDPEIAGYFIRIYTQVEPFNPLYVPADNVFVNFGKDIKFTIFDKGPCGLSERVITFK
jgi:hypothetical protein